MTDPAFPDLFINGLFVPALDGRRFETIDPATEEPIAQVARGGAADIDAAVKAAEAARHGPWGETTPAERGRMLMALADLVLAHREELAVLETRDVGKPLGGSRGDIDGVAETLRYNAGAADKIHGEVIPLGPRFVDFTMLEPVGVTAHIVPWNFPLGMALRSLAPALAAGCTAVVKPAEQSPLSSLHFCQLLEKAGIPPGVVNVVTGFGEEAGASLVAHADVRAVHFTGSVETGRIVAVAAARSFKPVVLELGGKNAMIVLADADLDRAVESALEGGFDNCGQVCSASSRFLVHRDVVGAFTARLVARVSALSIGPGMENPDLGPLVSAEQLAKVMAHIHAAQSAGVHLLTGGHRPKNLHRGYFIAPAVFANVDPSLPIAREEVFGPVVTITPISSDGEAVEIANSVSTGLVAGVHTSDISRALSIVRRLQTGSVWVNGWYMGGVQAPTGGEKDSGLGRERGIAGIRNFLRIKNVAIRL